MTLDALETSLSAHAITAGAGSFKFEYLYESNHDRTSGIYPKFIVPPVSFPLNTTSISGGKSEVQTELKLYILDDWIKDYDNDTITRTKKWDAINALGKLFFQALDGDLVITLIDTIVDPPELLDQGQNVDGVIGLMYTFNIKAC